MVGNGLMGKKQLGIGKETTGNCWQLVFPRLPKAAAGLGWKSVISVVIMIKGEGEISVFSTGLETPNTISILRLKRELCLLQVSCSLFASCGVLALTWTASPLALP